MRRIVSAIVFTALVSQPLFAAGGPAPDITVAQDGSGKFTSVAAALASIPQSNKERITVYVKDGI